MTRQTNKMPYACSDGRRIRYETAGEGAMNVLLVHGFSDSLDDWREAGYVDALKSDFRLIAFDCLGHGRSDKPRAPEAYSMARLADDAIAVMDAAGAETAVYWGYSMGARIAFGFAERAPHRASAMILAGIDRFGTHPDAFRRRIRFLSAGIAPYLEGLEARIGRMQPESKRQRFLQNDHLALIAASVGLRDGYGGYDALIPRMAMPCLVYDGDKDAFHDGARELADMLPNAEFASLPEQDHGGTFARSDLALPLVRDFLRKLAADG